MYFLEFRLQPQQDVYEKVQSLRALTVRYSFFVLIFVSGAFLVLDLIGSRYPAMIKSTVISYLFQEDHP